MKRVTAKTPPSWVLVVRESATRYERDTLRGMKTATSEDVYRLVAPRILIEEVEVMYVLCLDGQNHVKHMAEIARGGLHGCTLSGRDVLRVVLCAGASCFILVHNHPSGDPTPSPEDRHLTNVVAAGAELLGTPLVDHVIIAGNRYSSALDDGWMP